jgi:hypothetical protein
LRGKWLGNYDSAVKRLGTAENVCRIVLLNECVKNVLIDSSQDASGFFVSFWSVPNSLDQGRCAAIVRIHNQ